MQLLFFTFGAMIGSFLNVLIIRLPVSMNFVTKRSHCPHCQRTISWFDNIPVLSFLILLGKCRYCKGKISWQYPVVEIIVGVFSMGLSFFIIDKGDLYSYFFSLSILSLLTVHFVIDIKHYLLLDSINILIGVLFIVTQFLHKVPWHEACLGFAVGLGIPWLVTYLFYKMRGVVGLGGGDIKLFAVSGIYLGPTKVMELIFQSCTLGAIFGIFYIYLLKKDKNTPYPFGPFIIITLFIHLFFPQLAESMNFGQFLLAP